MAVEDMNSLVIVQVSSCPACISPLQSEENTGSRATNPDGVIGPPISLTSYGPIPSDTRVPGADEPSNELIE